MLSLLLTLPGGVAWAESAGATEPAEEAPAPGGEGGEGGEVTPAEGAAETPAAAEAPAAEADELAEARQRFRQGVALARAGNCDSAIAEFGVSLELARRPVTLYNIAQCQERLHRYDLALRYYREYLDEAPADDPDRGSVETTMRLLGNLLGTVHVSCNVPAEVWIDDRRMGDAPGDVPVPSGRHLVELRADGYLSAQEEIEIAGGQELELELTLEEARTEVTIHEHTTERVRLHQAYFWTGAALTVASAAVAAGLGGWALSLRNDQEEVDARIRSQADLDEIDRAAMLTDIFWGVTGAFAIATVIIGVLTDWGGDDDESEGAEQSGRRVRASLMVAGQGFGLTLGGAL